MEKKPADQVQIVAAKRMMGSLTVYKTDSGSVTGDLQWKEAYVSACSAMLLATTSPRYSHLSIWIIFMPSGLLPYISTVYAANHYWICLLPLTECP